MLIQRMSNSHKSVYLCVCLCAVTVFYLICHLFILMNPSYSHDALLVVSETDNAHQIALGRFLQPIYRAIRGNVTAPWLLGLLSIVLLTLAAYVMLRTLEIRSVPAVILSAGFFTTNTTVTFSNATFLPWIDVYALALLLAALAAFLAARTRYGFLPGALCLFCSLGLYQSFSTVTIGIIMLLTLRLIFTKAGFKAVRNTILLGMLTVALGFAFYLAGTHLANFVVPASDAYNGLSNVKESFLQRDTADAFVETYRTFFHEIGSVIADRKLVSRVVLLLVSAISAGALWKLARKQRLSVRWMLFSAAVICLLPFGLNINYFISGKAVYHSLMNYGCFLIYLLPILLCDLCWACGRQGREAQETASAGTRRWWKPHVWLAVCLGILIFNNIVFANAIYTKKYLQASATLSVMTRVVDRIEAVEGFVPGETPIAIVGSLNESALLPQTSEFDGYTGVGIEANSFAVTYRETYLQYLRYILGYPVPEITEEEENRLKETSQVAGMPAFPAAGCCEIVDGYLVVKLSEY